MGDDALTVRDRLAAGHYDVSEAERLALPYEATEALWRARWAEFRADAIAEAGLAGHPEADRAFAIADEWAGEERLNVVALLEQIAGLLLGDDR